MSSNYIEANAFYYRDPSQRLDVLPDVFDLSFLNEISGNGAGKFTVSANDPHLIETPASRYYRTIVKLSCGGTVRGGFVVQNMESSLLDKGEESDETITLSGDGLRSLLADIAVMPVTGQLLPQSMDDRVFSWASPQGIWYDASKWVQPVRVEQYGMLPSSPNKYWKYQPAEWPDAPNAWWIWSQAPVNNFTPSGYVYFRTQFTVAAGDEGDYSLFIAGDDKYQAYIDASLVVDGTAAGNHHAKTERYDFTLSAGTHILAIKGWNKTGTNLKTNFAGIITALYKVGDADAGEAAKQVLVSTNGGWRCLAYPDAEPGWSVGEILIQLLKEGSDRGVRAAQWITPNFTETLDSQGVAWANRLPYSFNVGDSLLDVIEKMEELEVEAWIDPDTLQLNVAQQRGTDRTVGDAPVSLNMGWNLMKAGTNGEADITNTLLMKTDDGWVIQQDADSVAKYGPVEGTLSTNANAEQSQKLAKKIFSRHADAEEGSDYDLISRPGAEPFVDFDLGDWVLAPDKDGHMARRRVMSISVTSDAAGNPVYAIEFDTIFQTKQQEADRIAKLAAGSGLGSGFAFGSASGGSGTGSPVTSDGSAGRPSPPLSPANLTVTSVGTFGTSGEPQATATFSWDFVSLAEDGNAVRGISSYRVYGRLNNAPDASGVLLATVNGALSTAKVSGLKSDEDYLFWVVAVVSDDRYSSESPAVPHHTAYPGPNMYPPTTPTLTTKLGTITAAWDGKMTNGQKAPASVNYVFAEYSTSATGTFTTIGNTVSSASTIVLTGLTIGTTYYVRLRARDKASNLSDPSTVASIKVDGVNTTDLGQAIQDRITAVESNASTALTNANNASQAATNASNAVTQLSKTTGIVYSSTKPSADNAGKLWIKPTGESYVYDTGKSDWVQVSDPAIVQAAKNAADALNTANQASGTAQNAATQAGNALTAANGKNRNWYQTSSPPTTGNTVGDNWWNTGSDYALSRWDGNAWTPALLGNAAFSAIDAAKISTGILDAGRIGANSITSRMLAVGDFKEYLNNLSFEDASTLWTFPDSTSAVDSTVSRTGSKSIKFNPPATSLGPIKVLQTNLYTDPRLTTSTDWSGSAQGGSDTVTISTVSGGVLPPLPTVSTRVRGASDKGTASTITIQRTFPATAGKVYSQGAYLYSRGSTAGYFIMYIQWLDSTGTQIGSTVTSPQLTRTSDWQRISLVNQTAPSGTTQYRVLFRRFAASGTVSVSDSVDLTGYMLNEGATLNDYFDGAVTNDDTTGYQWTGTADASTSQKYNYGDQTAKAYYYQGGDIPVLEGQFFGFSGYARRDTTYDGSVAGAFVGFVDTATNVVLGRGYIDKNTISTVGSWVSFSGSVQVPRGTTFIRPVISVNHTKGTLWVDDVSAKVQAGGTLIADGSVTTSKVAANAITANNLQAGSVDTVALKANAVQAVNLAAEAITAKHTITGALIRTADTGPRTEMSADGIQVLDSTGTPLVRMGYGIDTGMSVLDQTSGNLVPLGNQVFGTKGITRETVDNVPNGSTTAWGSTVEVATGLTGISPTGRALVYSTVQIGDMNYSQDYRYQWWIRVLRSSDSKLISDTFCGEFGGRQPTTFFTTVSVPATQQMTIRLLVQSYQTYGASSQAKIGRRSTAFIPI